MALVGVADVKVAVALHRIRITKVGAWMGDARRSIEDRPADQEHLAEDRLARLAHSNGEGRPRATRVRRGGAHEVALAAAEGVGQGTGRGSGDRQFVKTDWRG